MKKKENEQENKRYIKALLRKAVFLTITIILFFRVIFGIQIMQNDAMSPKITPSDLLIYYRLDRKFQAGDVVVIRNRQIKTTLRVVAVSGDKVDITSNGLYINGALQHDLGIFYPTKIYKEGISFPITVKKDEVFALGDLREGAIDSRYYGAIKKKDIKGKVFVLLRRANF